MLPLFQLPAIADSRSVRTWDYRQTRNLAIFVLHRLSCATCRKRLDELAADYAQYRAAETEILAIVADGGDALAGEVSALPFPVLRDRDCRVRVLLLGTHAADPPAPLSTGLLVCGRYGYVYCKLRALDADYLLDRAQLLSWLEAMEMQCPECRPPQKPQSASG